MKNQRGFSLIEMLVALVILSVGVLGFGASTGFMMSQGSGAGVKAEALQAVEGRLSQIVMDPRYQNLATLYAGTKTNLPGLAGCTMVTTVTQTKTLLAGRYTDYKTVMVTVSGPGITGTVSRTLIVGAP